jgi:hypothetical protein
MAGKFQNIRGVENFPKFSIDFHVLLVFIPDPPCPGKLFEPNG